MRREVTKIVGQFYTTTVLSQNGHDRVCLNKLATKENRFHELRIRYAHEQMWSSDLHEIKSKWNNIIATLSLWYALNIEDRVSSHETQFASQRPLACCAVTLMDYIKKTRNRNTTPLTAGSHDSHGDAQGRSWRQCCMRSISKRKIKYASKSTRKEHRYAINSKHIATVIYELT